VDRFILRQAQDEELGDAMKNPSSC